MKNLVKLDDYRKRREKRPSKFPLAVLILYALFLGTCLVMCVQKIESIHRDLQKIQYEDPYQEFDQ